MAPLMSAAEFSRLAEEWATEVTSRAVALFKDGVHVDQCLKIAIQIHDAKVLAQRQSTAALVQPPYVISRN